MNFGLWCLVAFPLLCFWTVPVAILGIYIGIMEAIIGGLLAFLKIDYDTPIGSKLFEIAWGVFELLPSKDD
jgi:hypothetical protein